MLEECKKYAKVMRMKKFSLSILSVACAIFLGGVFVAVAATTTSDTQSAQATAEASAAYSESMEAVRLQLSQAGLNASEYLGTTSDQPTTSAGALEESLSTVTSGFTKGMSTASGALVSLQTEPRLSYNADKIVDLIEKIVSLDKHAEAMASTYERRKSQYELRIVSLLRKVLAEAVIQKEEQRTYIEDALDEAANALHENTPLKNGALMELVQRGIRPMASADRAKIQTALEKLKL